MILNVLSLTMSYVSLIQNSLACFGAKFCYSLTLKIRGGEAKKKTQLITLPIRLPPKDNLSCIVGRSRFR
jgi:hypothetical protein